VLSWDLTVPKVLSYSVGGGEIFNGRPRPDASLDVGGSGRWPSIATGDEVRWVVSAENADSRVEIDFACPKVGMITVDYENPDGFATTASFGTTVASTACIDRRPVCPRRPAGYLSRRPRRSLSAFFRLGRGFWRDAQGDGGDGPWAGFVA
jgi:hypothetical protein